MKVHGNPSSLGLFEARNSNFPLEEGIVLSTGRVSAIARQNESGKTTTSMKESVGSDPDLSRMVTRQVFNCTVLEFDFIPMFDSLYFDYVFGSEEYPEYVGSPYNDVFCLLIYGPNFKKPINLARVGHPSATVMINSVNQKKNQQYFIPNYGKRDSLLTPYTIEYDGFTTSLTASCRVTRGKVHHLKIAIGNVNDFSYDSGVFLRAGSFGSRGGQMPKLLPFDFDARNPDSGYESVLDSLADLLKSNPTWRMAVLGHTDSIGSEAYNLKLSQDRAQSVANALIKR
ncbi:MAG: OmpA family protein, partial [Bacteroidota bacterium]|nr:OmpA family protein [Bacteroidota bacterium]MDX5430232.1 OmpA family protein [Bacteroidota bacterium]MDX5468993.1 OmpA family protein [Bacteroidota bacterium]